MHSVFTVVSGLVRAFSAFRTSGIIPGENKYPAVARSRRALERMAKGGFSYHTRLMDLGLQTALRNSKQTHKCQNISRRRKSGPHDVRWHPLNISYLKTLDQIRSMFSEWIACRSGGAYDTPEDVCCSQLKWSLMVPKYLQILVVTLCNFACNSTTYLAILYYVQPKARTNA